LRKLTSAILLLTAAPFVAHASDAPPPTVEIPFGCGLAFPVSQTHNIGSHVQNDTWAWDFRMPVGTPVVAATDGYVRMARGDSSSGGCDPSFAKDANYVVIDAPNGYETQYLHFSRVVVHAGEKVHQGDLLGYSGETGWACGAHLHFKVARPTGSGWNNPSVPARLDGYGDPKLESIVASRACKPQDQMITASNEKRPDAPDKNAVETAAFRQAVRQGELNTGGSPDPAKGSAAAALKASTTSAKMAVMGAATRSN
jgi:murein DD-endopeptidase MepM/ murein hydrolase activator NlpD